MPDVAKKRKEQVSAAVVVSPEDKQRPFRLFFMANK